MKHISFSIYLPLILYSTLYFCNKRFLFIMIISVSALVNFFLQLQKNTRTHIPVFLHFILRLKFIYYCNIYFLINTLFEMSSFSLASGSEPIPPNGICPIRFQLVGKSNNFATASLITGL